MENEIRIVMPPAQGRRADVTARAEAFPSPAKRCNALYEGFRDVEPMQTGGGMSVSYDLLFVRNPDPMWIFDLETLRILDVNMAAEGKFGYTRDELLSMTIADIRPPEDVPALRARIAGAGTGIDDAGVWRFLHRDGTVFHVDITWQEVDQAGRRAKLASLRDVTHLVELERENARLLEREQAHRLTSERAARRFEELFRAVPGKYLALSPTDFRIEAVSDAFLAATRTRREDIQGRLLFDVFPYQPDGSGGEAAQTLQRSLERVLHSGMPDVMGVQRAYIPGPGGGKDGHEERYWTPVNTPIKDSRGEIGYIIHRIEDVTEFLSTALEAGESASSDALSRTGQLELDILLRSAELRSANARLMEQESHLRTAQRLLKIGTWNLDIDTGALRVSDGALEILGMTREAFGADFDSFLRLVHPDDREEMREQVARVQAAQASMIDFRGRIARPDGIGARHFHCVGEVLETGTERSLAGVWQDTTDEIETNERLSRTSELMRIAGKVGKLGGWQVDFGKDRIYWSAETAAIHGEGPEFEPTMEQAIGYYVPEHRDRITACVTACRERGEPFDEVLQIVTAQGARRWVRTAGEPVPDPDGNITLMRGAFQDITDWVAAREESLNLSQKLAETLESINDGFLILDHDWRFGYLNHQAETLIEGRREDLLGRNIWEAFPAARGTVFQNEYERAVRERITVRFTEYYPPMNRWFQVSAYPSHDGLAVYFRDVTRERADQTQLRLLETAVARMDDILLITEAEPLDAPHGPPIVYVNDAFTRHTGYSREQAIGATPRILQGPRTQRDVLDRVGKALRRWQPVQAEVINYTKAGEEFWLEMNISPVFDASGKQTHWVSVERDISDRKAAEEALRITEERFRIVARATNDVIWEWEFDTDRFHWNDDVEPFFGHAPQEVEPDSSSWTGRIHPSDHERVLAGIRGVIEGGGVNWEDEYRFLRAQGGYAQVQDRGYVIRDGQGRAVRMLGSMIDITDKREAQARERQSQKLAAVGQLTGGVAHDFNNLLTIILGNAELLIDALPDQQPLRQMAEVTASAAERGAELTRRLLAFSRRQPLDPKPVDLNQLVSSMDAMLQRTLSANMEIELAGGEGLWTTEIDPGQFEVALLNLALNARDSMPRGGKITIETANAQLDQEYATAHEEVLAGQYVRVTVTDTGTGMDAETAERAFEPFFTTKEEGKGNGLGLSMVYGFVKQSGGHIKVYSEPGEGTAVRLYFPRALCAASEHTASEPQDEAVGGSEHILVVEDDTLVRAHVTSLLGGLGYTVSGAQDGREALEILQREPKIALLFTDVVMPGGLNGRELAEEALRRRPDIRVLYTSGYTEDAIVHHGRLDPGVELLSKPYRRSELAAKLRHILDA